MTRHHDSQAIWFLSIPGRFSKVLSRYHFTTPFLLEGPTRESLYNRSSFCPWVFFRNWATLLLGSMGTCSLVSLAWSDVTSLSFVDECALPRSEIGYHSNHMAISYFACSFLCVLAYILAGIIGWLLVHVAGRTSCLLGVCHCLSLHHSHTALFLNHTLTVSLQQPSIPTAAICFSIPRQ